MQFKNELRISLILTLLFLSQVLLAQVPLRHEYIVTKKLDIDNIQIDGNSIISTNTNGNISITPNGAGVIVTGSILGTGALDFDNLRLDGSTISSQSGNLIFDTSQSFDEIQFNKTVLVGGTAPTTPVGHGIFEVQSTTAASIPAPVMTTSQKNSLSPTTGAMVFDSDLGKLQVANGTAWSSVGSGSGGGDVNYINNYGAEDNANGWTTCNENITFNSVNTGNDRVVLNETLTLRENTPVLYTNSGGTVIGGLTSGTTYYVSGIGVVGGQVNSMRLAATPDGSDIDLTSSGSGTHTFVLQEPSACDSTTANVTLARSATDPLTGTGSFIFTKDASNRIREGISTAFTVDNSQKGKVMRVSLTGLVDSGTFTAGSSNLNPSDVVVWIVDSNNRLIQPSTYYIGSNSSTIPWTLESTFQTSTDTVDYRYILYIRSTTTNAFALKLDDITVSPSKYVYGTPITDWQTYTPTFSAAWGSVSNISFLWRRVGADAEIKGTFLVGTRANSIATITLPSGLAISTTGTTVQNTTAQPGPIIGQYRSSESAANAGGNIVTATGTSASLIYFASADVNAASHVTPANGDAVTASGVSGAIELTVPIAGWSSSVQMSDNASTRVVAMVANTTTTLGGTSTPYVFSNVVQDTHGGYNASTGVYTVQVPGTYYIQAWMKPSVTATQNLRIRKNGATLYEGLNSGSIASYPVFGVATFVAGDTIDITSSGAMTGNGNATQNMFSVSRISGPSTIAATETIAASAYCSANRAGTTSAPFNFDTIEYDTHGIITTGSSWKATAPIPGLYRISVAGSLTAGGNSSFFIYKNGSIYKFLLGTNTNFAGTPSSTTLNLLAGDYIEIRPSTSVSLVGGTLSTANTSSISIERIGGR